MSVIAILDQNLRPPTAGARGEALVVFGLLLLFSATPALTQVEVDGIVGSTDGGFRFPDGTVQTTAARPYQNVVTVAAGGADFGSIQAALDSIVDADADNRYLVSVAPGVYSETVTMKPYVDVRGSGEQTTEITATGSSTPAGATLFCADESGLRDLSVTNSGDDAYAIAILCDGTSPHLERVSAASFSASESARAIELLNGATASLVDARAAATGSGSGVAVGISMTGSSPTLVDVEAIASAGDVASGVAINLASPTLVRVSASASLASTTNNGIVCSGSGLPVLDDVSASASLAASATNHGLALVGCSAIVRRSVLEASGGTVNYGLFTSLGVSDTVTVNHSEISGATATVRSETGVSIFLGGSKLDGGAVDTSAGGTVTCAGVHDENHAPFGATCP